ncbi:DUF5683 domain-containing protein [Limibacter armeniacum]|uniref:DUF5683 domain-containing protein n=1 Tax=Limibacter armeniacum TaxID=466084 RepID=UPI002FE63EA5
MAGQVAFAQNTYEVTEKGKNTQVKKQKEKKPPKPQHERLHTPSRRALASAILPGLGQIQNKKYWKVPIIYGGFAVFGWLVKENHVNYIESRNFYTYLSDGDPQNDALIPERFQGLTADSFQTRRDNFRRDQDYYTIIMFLWYGLNIADAAVDAHLKRFDVSEDLSGVVKPALIRGPFNNPAMGLTLAFNFKH